MQCVSNLTPLKKIHGTISLSFPNDEANEIVIIYGFWSVFECFYTSRLLVSWCSLYSHSMNSTSNIPSVCSWFFSFSFISSPLATAVADNWYKILAFQIFHPTKPFAKNAIKVWTPLISKTQLTQSSPELFFSFQNKSVCDSSQFFE